MPCYNIEMDLLGLHPRLPLVLPSLQSCLPVERQSWKDSNTVSKSQGPELGFSNTAIAQGERGGHSRKARAEQGRMDAKAATCPHPAPIPPDIWERQEEKGSCSRRDPLLSSLGASLRVQGHGVWSWGTYFLYYYVSCYCSFGVALL